MKVDQETGEILEQELPFKVKEGFVINDQSSFEWVMEKIQREESEINCLKQQKANLEAMIKRQESNLAAIHYRFDNELVHYAKENSDGKKSLLCQFGKVAWRETKPKWKVVDEGLAVAWAKRIGLKDAVKTEEKFLVSGIGNYFDGVDSSIADVVGLELIPAGESVTIKGEC